MMRHHTLCECSDITLCVGAVAGEEEERKRVTEGGGSLAEVGEVAEVEEEIDRIERMR